MPRFLLATLIAGSFVATDVLADGKHASHAGHAAEKPYGKPGDPKKVSRTIEVGMNDAMRFTPAQLSVKRGETIRFVVGNSGKIKHELVLGTMNDLKAHVEAMKKPHAKHEEDETGVEVDPGKRGELVWQFTKAGTFSYGCLIPGHFEAGMIGSITVR
jgi:uncharacterized cupredoxin-like copper-binding protein